MGRARPGSPRLKDRHTVNSNHLQFFYPIACPSPHGVRVALHAAGTAQPAKQGCGQPLGLINPQVVHTPVISQNHLFPASPAYLIAPFCHCTSRSLRGASSHSDVAISCCFGDIPARHKVPSLIGDIIPIFSGRSVSSATISSPQGKQSHLPSAICHCETGSFPPVVAIPVFRRRAATQSRPLAERRKDHSNCIGNNRYL